MAVASELHRTKRGETSRTAIFGAALDLFQERGYEATTMRAIADRAGVTLGSSYHYFASKEHLVLEFYRHTHELHIAVVTPLLSREKDLGARLKGVIRAVVVTCEPFHDAAGSIFSSVANPSSPVNPFGATARPLRDEVIGMYAEVVRGSGARIPADLATHPPLLPWLYPLGVLHLRIFHPVPWPLRTR